MTRLVKTVAQPAVGVCGFGRCGSTMVMSMLAAGGLPPAAGSAPHSYELPSEAAIVTARPQGQAIKLLDHFGRLGLPQAAAWRFVWLDRDATQQARSHAKLAAAIGFEMSAELQGLFAASYAADRPGLLGQLRAVGPVLVLEYERVLRSPVKAARLLRRDVWPALDVTAAAAAVHDREPECLPDMAFELGARTTARSLSIPTGGCG